LLDESLDDLELHANCMLTYFSRRESAAQPGAVVSVGEDNIYRHPSEEVMDRLEQTAPVVHRTDRDGALVLRSNGREWQVVDWH